MPRRLIRWAGPGALFLLGSGLQVSGWIQPAVGVALILLGVMWGLLALPPIAERLPRLRLVRPGTRRDDGPTDWSVQYVPGQRLSRKRLREETLALVAELHDYAEQYDSPLNLENLRRRLLSEESMRRAKTEGERSALLDRNHVENRAEMEHRDRESERLFGGRFRYIAAQYHQRGLLDYAARRDIEMWWPAHKGQIAAKLEALARSL